MGARAITYQAKCLTEIRRLNSVGLGIGWFKFGIGWGGGKGAQAIPLAVSVTRTPIPQKSDSDIGGPDSINARPDEHPVG
jgi:hypothetical protein